VWQLSPFDDFLVHQAPQPIDQPITSDRHFNDGYWFGFYSRGRYAFCGMRAHPNNNVIDGYAGMVIDHEQRNLRFSRAYRPDVNSWTVGPFRIEVLEPLKRQRLTLGPSDIGIEWEVEMDAYGLWTEARHLQHRHGVVLNDLLRYTGVCQPSGWVEIDGTRTDVGGWYGARDHSWGIRSTMGPRTPLGGRVAGAARDPRAIRIWVPFRTEKRFGFFHTHEDADGNVLDFEGQIHEGDEVIELASVRHQFEYHPGSRRLSAGEYTLTDAAGDEHRYHFRVVCDGVHVQGFGYNQGWSDGAGPGNWRGADVQESSRFDTSDPNASGAAIHLPANRRIGATEFAVDLQGPDGDAGMGMVEHAVYGTYRPYGFEGPTRF
jgi:hypothetical protein